MITLADARRIISAAEKEAEQFGQPMNIAVVDAGAIWWPTSGWIKPGSAVSIFQ